MLDFRSSIQDSPPEEGFGDSKQVTRIDSHKENKIRGQDELPQLVADEQDINFLAPETALGLVKDGWVSYVSPSKPSIGVLLPPPHLLVNRDLIEVALSSLPIEASAARARPSQITGKLAAYQDYFDNAHEEWSYKGDDKCVASEGDRKWYPLIDPGFLYGAQNGTHSAPGAAPHNMGLIEKDALKELLARGEQLETSPRSVIHLTQITIANEDLKLGGGYPSPDGGLKALARKLWCRATGEPYTPHEDLRECSSLGGQLVVVKNLVRALMEALPDPGIYAITQSPNGLVPKKFCGPYEILQGAEDTTGLVLRPPLSKEQCLDKLAPGYYDQVVRWGQRSIAGTLANVFALHAVADHPIPTIWGHYRDMAVAWTAALQECINEGVSPDLIKSIFRGGGTLHSSGAAKLDRLLGEAISHASTGAEAIKKAQEVALSPVYQWAQGIAGERVGWPSIIVNNANERKLLQTHRAYNSPLGGVPLPNGRDIPILVAPAMPNNAVFYRRSEKDKAARNPEVEAAIPTVQTKMSLLFGNPQQEAQSDNLVSRLKGSLLGVFGKETAGSFADPKKPTLVVVGRFDREKGWTEIVDQFNHQSLKEKFNLLLVIQGISSSRKTLDQDYLREVENVTKDGVARGSIRFIELPGVELNAFQQLLGENLEQWLKGKEAAFPVGIIVQGRRKEPHGLMGLEAGATGNPGIMAGAQALGDQAAQYYSQRGLERPHYGAAKYLNPESFVTFDPYFGTHGIDDQRLSLGSAATTLLNRLNSFRDEGRARLVDNPFAPPPAGEETDPVKQLAFLHEHGKPDAMLKPYTMKFFVDQEVIGQANMDLLCLYLLSHENWTNKIVDMNDLKQTANLMKKATSSSLYHDDVMRQIEKRRQELETTAAPTIIH